MNAAFVTRIFLIVAVLLLIDFYAFQAVRTFTRDYSSRIRLVIHVVYWMINISIFVVALYGLFRFNRYSGPTHYFSRVFAFFLMFFIPKLFVVVFLLVEDVFRLFHFLFNLASSALTNAPSPAFDDRRRFLSQLALLVSALPFASVVHGVTRGKYKYTVHRIDLEFDDLPSAFDGFRISQISDVHSGSLEDKAEISKGIDLINELKADVILFTGDLVNNKASEMDPWINVFSKLKAPFGKFSVLGNHDYGTYINWKSPEEKAANDARLLEVHKEIGFRLLRNENVKLERGNDSLNLIGVENWGLPPFPQLGDLDKASKDLNGGFNILMSHDPSHWKARVLDFSKHIHITLSGHTHGMQFGIEIPGIKWSPVKYRYPEWAGLYSKENKHLYVNRGFGYIGFPGRVGIWPEVTVITLKRKK